MAECSGFKPGRALRYREKTARFSPGRYTHMEVRQVRLAGSALHAKGRLNKCTDQNDLIRRSLIDIP